MAKRHNLNVTEWSVSSSSVISKHVQATYSQLTAEHEIFGKTASLRQVAISTLACRSGLAYVRSASRSAGARNCIKESGNQGRRKCLLTLQIRMRCDQNDLLCSLQQGKACFRSLVCRFAAVRRLSLKRLGPPCLQVGETDRQLGNQESCLSKTSTKMQLLIGERTWLD